MLRIGSLLVVLFVVVGALVAPVRAQDAAAPRRVLLVSIDGLRPDVALRGEMPVLRTLMSRGSFTFWANTTDVAVTIPSHVSMVTGVPPEVHGISWNGGGEQPEPLFPRVPTLFELAKKQGLSTAMVAGKTKFTALTPPQTLDWSYIPPSGHVSTQTIADEAIKVITTHKPVVMLLHFPNVDTIGHAHGWGGGEQLQAIKETDAAMGTVLAALDTAGVLDATLIIVTSDHGGAGKSHGGTDPRSRHIPWVIAGPGVRANRDLTRDTELVVNTEDTFATACDFLSIPLPNDIKGKPIKQAFEMK